MPKQTPERIIDRRQFVAGGATVVLAGSISSSTLPNNSDHIDYIIYTQGANCYALDTGTGTIAHSGTNHASVIQSALDSAGVDSSVAFRTDVYNIGTALEPYTRQTLIFPAGALFVPTGDNGIWNLETVDRVAFHGTCTCWDANTTTTSAAAITIEDVAKCHFQHISIVNYYNGVNMTGTAGGTHENYFDDLQIDIRNRGLNMETSCHDNHFNHVWIQGPDPENWSSGSGLRIATGGTQGGNIFGTIEILHCNTGMDLPGAYEVWFGNVLVDNAYGIGIYMAGPVEALFFDTIWSSSSGTGIQMGGNADDVPTTRTDKIHINKCYCWLNADYGVRVTGYTQQVMIGNLTVERNAKGLGFEGHDNRDWTINSLYAFDNTEYDLCGSGVEQNVVIQTAQFESLVDVDLFTTFEGTDITTGKPTTAYGTGTISNGNSSASITHGLESEPVFVGVTGQDSETASPWVSARTGTTFMANVSSSVTADRAFMWFGRSNGPLGSNLVANWSVEDGAGTPTNWTASGAGATCANDDPDNAPSLYAHSGQYGLRLNVSAASASWTSAQFTVTSSTDYQLRAFVKGTGSAGVTLNIKWYAAGPSYLSTSTITLNNTWTGFTMQSDEFTSPGTAVLAEVVYDANSTTADLYADSFSIREVL